MNAWISEVERVAEGQNAPRDWICRDCCKRCHATSTLRRCPDCGSPRLLSHSELDRLEIAHIDCDAFYASVEKRDNPELLSKPVIIGGGTRGVVATACYIARIRGVRSAMPMYRALAACPDAVVIKPNMAKYSETGKQIREMMRELTPLVEPLSIDEAFLDLSGTARLHKAPPAEVLVRFAKRVREEVGLTVSVGLSYCKFLAKVASDLDKPSGFAIIGEAEAWSFLRRQGVSIVWGVGKATQAMLARDGITRIAQVQDMEETELMRRYGTIGRRLSRLARGLDSRSIDPTSPTKSISAEVTFNIDKRGEAELLPILRKLSEKVAKRLKKQDLAGQTVVLKLKTADFKTRTRNRHLTDPTQLADRIFTVGRQLLEKELDGTAFRLLGIGLSTLGPDDLADPDDLVDLGAARRAKVESAMDDLRARFGDQTIETGLTFDADKDYRPQRDK